MVVLKMQTQPERVMLTKETESTAQTLHTIGQDLQKERQRLLRVKDSLDRIEREHAIMVIKLADRH